MKTNKQKALEYLQEQLGHIYCHNCKFNDDREECDDCYRKKMGWEASDELINTSIKIASKPDWYYPSKGELPFGNTSKVLVKLYHNDEIMEYRIGKETEVNKKYYIKFVEAWTYLPKFEKK